MHLLEMFLSSKILNVKLKGRPRRNATANHKMFCYSFFLIFILFVSVKKLLPKLKEIVTSKIESK